MGAVVGAVIGVGATMKSMKAQEQAAEAQLKAMKEQQKMQMMADARERRKMLREAAIARGQTAMNIGSALPFQFKGFGI